MASVMALSLALFVLTGGVQGNYWMRGSCTGAERAEYHEETLDVGSPNVWTTMIQQQDHVDNYEECFKKCFVRPGCRSIYWESATHRCHVFMAKMDTLRSISAQLGNSTRGNWIGGPLKASSAVDLGRKRYPSCDAFCNYPTAFCIQDCNSEPISCAVEESSCTESKFDRRANIRSALVQHDWHTPARDFFYYSFKKSYPNTHFRVRVVSTQGLHQTETGSGTERGIYVRVNMHSPHYGWRECHGKNFIRLKTVATYRGRANYPHWNSNLGDYGYAFEGICMDMDMLAHSSFIFRFREDCISACGGGNYYRWGMYHHTFVEIEELLVADHHMLLDQTAECKEKTSFNVQQRDFNTEYSSGADNYMLANFYISYNKISPSSTLRVYLGTNIYNDWANKAKRLEFKINGLRGRDICADKNDLVASWLAYTYGETGEYKAYRGTDHFNMDVICRGLPPGMYRIQLYSYWGIDPAPGVIQGPNYHVGHGGESTVTVGRWNSNWIIAEEVNEGVPVNAVLLDDGTLRRFTTFNRQYQLHGNAIENVLDYSNLRQFAYKKLHDKSVLHIRYYDGHGYRMDGGHPRLCKSMYININGEQCNDPATIGRKNIFDWQYLYFSKPMYLEGYCKGSPSYPAPVGHPAGTYTFSVQEVASCTNRYSILGAGTIGHWMVEEIFL